MASTWHDDAAPRPGHRWGDLLVIAATIGSTRLIDNVKAATPERRGADPKGAVSVLPAP